MQKIPNFIIQKKLPKPILDYIQMRLDDTSYHEVNIDFRRGKNIKIDGTFFTGCFYDEEWEITIATGRPWQIWFPIFIHETCHFDQWKEGVDVWNRLQYKGRDIYEIIDTELDSQNPDMKLFWECITRMRDMELDCEKRTLAEIKKYKLPIDVPELIRGINVYMYWHMVVYVLRRYHDKKYGTESSLKLRKYMPNKIQKSYDNMPLDYVQLYLEHGF
jgi:hypothetical protein